MITRALNSRRSGSRRPRPSRFPTPGFPRGASASGYGATPRAVSSAGFARATLGGGIGRGGYPGVHAEGVGVPGWPPSEVLVAALVMVGGIFLWGGLFVLLAG